jgi:hypothetical protein
MYERMQKNRERPESSADEALNWSSFVLPFVESAYAAGDRQLASSTVEAISDRIYGSMDRRSLQSVETPHARLGWPGTSCEVWGAHGAFGGEVYGWGAVMPAHIIRNIIGFRESAEPGEFELSPSFGDALVSAGKRYALAGLPYAGRRISVSYAFSGEKQLTAELKLPVAARIVSVSDTHGEAVKFTRGEAGWQIPMENHGQYRIKTAGLAAR